MSLFAAICFAMICKGVVGLIQKPIQCVIETVVLILLILANFCGAVSFAVAAVLGCKGRAACGVRIMAAYFSLNAAKNVIYIVGQHICREDVSEAQWICRHVIVLAHTVNNLELAMMFLYWQRHWHIVLVSVGCNYLGTGLGKAKYWSFAHGIVDLCLGTIALSIVAWFFTRHHIVLRRAWRDLRPDRARYEERWNALKETQTSDLEDLAEIAQEHEQEKVIQPLKDLDGLFAVAEMLNEWYQETVEGWANVLHLRHKRAPLKKWERVLEKVQRSYQGDVTRVLDFVRSSLIVDTVAEAKKALEFALDQAKVHALKNRYDPSYDGKVTAGYRDINLQLSFPEMEGTGFSGYIFELQIILATFLEVKSDEGHKRYILCRNLRGD